MYKNYVFDFYGTLADIHTDENDPVLWEKTAAYYTENGAAYEPDELRGAYLTLTEEETNNVKKKHPDYKHVDIKIEKVFRTLYEKKGVAPDDDLVERTALFFRRTSREYLRLYDGIDKLLPELRKHGRVFLLTNAQRSFTWDEICEVGLDKAFDGIIISSDEECSKPDIHFYRILTERYNVDPSQSIMIGNDPVSDIKGGINAGFDTLYIHSNISPDINYNTGCTYFIPDGDTHKMRDYLI